MFYTDIESFRQQATGGSAAGAYSATKGELVKRAKTHECEYGYCNVYGYMIG